VSTRTCPSCGAEVPTSAARCKHCFHDFLDAPPKRSSGLILLAASIAIMICAGAGAMYFVLHRQAVKRNVVVDEESASIIWTITSSEGTSTERVPFSDIKEVEFVVGGSRATWEVYAITREGDRKLLNAADQSNLQDYAEHVAALMNTKVVEIRNIKDFEEKYTVEN
jgi:hypothetical protein